MFRLKKQTYVQIRTDQLVYPFGDTSSTTSTKSINKKSNIVWVLELCRNWSPSSQIGSWNECADMFQLKKRTYLQIQTDQLVHPFDNTSSTTSTKSMNKKSNIVWVLELCRSWSASSSNRSWNTCGDMFQLIVVRYIDVTK